MSSVSKWFLPSIVQTIRGTQILKTIIFENEIIYNFLFITFSRRRKNTDINKNS